MPKGQGYDPHYERIWQLWLQHEGGDKLVKDNGGWTKYGISQNANPDVDVRKLSEADAKELFYDRYYVPLGADRVPAEIIMVGANVGVPTAKKWMQAAAAANPETDEGWLKSFRAAAAQHYQQIAPGVSAETGIPVDNLLKSWTGRLGAGSSIQHGGAQTPQRMGIPQGAVDEFARIRQATQNLQLNTTPAMAPLNQFAQGDFAPQSKGLPPVFGAGSSPLGALFTGLGGQQAVDSQRQATMQSAGLAQQQLAENQRQQGLLQLRRQNIAQARSGVAATGANAQFNARLAALNQDFQRTHDVDMLRRRLQGEQALSKAQSAAVDRELDGLLKAWTNMTADPEMTGQGMKGGLTGSVTRATFDAIDTVSQSRDPEEVNDVLATLKANLESKLAGYLVSEHEQVRKAAERMINNQLKLVSDQVGSATAPPLDFTALSPDAMGFREALAKIPGVGGLANEKNRNYMRTRSEGAVGNVAAEMAGIESTRAWVDIVMAQEAAETAQLMGTDNLVLSDDKRRELIKSIETGLREDPGEYLREWRKVLDPEKTAPGPWLQSLLRRLKHDASTPTTSFDTTPPVDLGAGEAIGPLPEGQALYSPDTDLLGSVQAAIGLINEGQPLQQQVVSQIGRGLGAANQFAADINTELGRGQVALGETMLGAIPRSIPQEVLDDEALHLQNLRNVGQTVLGGVRKFFDAVPLAPTPREDPALIRAKANVLNSLDVPEPVNKARVTAATKQAKTHAQVLDKKTARPADVTQILERVRRGGQDVIDAYGGVEMILEWMYEAGYADPENQLRRAMERN